LADALLLRGYFIAGCGEICLSTVLSSEEIQGLTVAAEEALVSGDV
jgi:hypothetical protein